MHPFTFGTTQRMSHFVGLFSRLRAKMEHSPNCLLRGRLNCRPPIPPVRSKICPARKLKGAKQWRFFASSETAAGSKRPQLTLIKRNNSGRYFGPQRLNVFFLLLGWMQKFERRSGVCCKSKNEVFSTITILLFYWVALWSFTWRNVIRFCL